MPSPVHPSARRLVAAMATLMALTGCGGGDATDAILAEGERLPGGITVTSTAFGPGEPIPERFSCEGENVPPPLQWDGLPPGTAEVALVIEDPDAPDGTFVHWLVLGVDPGAHWRSSPPLRPPARCCRGARTTRRTSGPARPTTTGRTGTSSRCTPWPSARRCPRTAAPSTRSGRSVRPPGPAACWSARSSDDGRSGSQGRMAVASAS